MVGLTNASFDNFKNTLSDIIDLKLTNLKFVASNGIYCTQKLLILSAFPVLQKILPECSKCCEEVTIVLPEVTFHEVEESVRKMMLGDLTNLETILGFKNQMVSEVTEDNEKTSSMKKSSGLEIIKLKQPYINDVCEEVADNKLEVGEYQEILTFVESEVCEEEDISGSECEEEMSEQSQGKEKKIKASHVCSKCGKIFPMKYNLTRHMKAMHRKVRKCERCSEEFTDVDDLNIHLKSCWYNCELCEYRSYIKKRYDAHVRSHKKKEKKNQPLTERVTIVYK